MYEQIFIYCAQIPLEDISFQTKKASSYDGTADNSQMGLITPSFFVGR